MPHQGNIYLHYGLVLLVKPLPDKRYDGSQLDPPPTEEAIRAHAMRHLLRRFFKGKRDNTQAGEDRTYVEGFLRNWVKVSRITKVDEVSSSGITDAGPAVFVLIDTNPIDVESRTDVIGYDDFREKVRGVAPCAHVEQFRIKIECITTDGLTLGNDGIGTSGIGDPDDQDGMYHLASRICSAFVEYRILWGKTSPLLQSVPFDPVPLADIQPKHSRKNVGTVFRKIMDVQDAVDLACGCLDGAMNYFPPVPEQMRDVFEGLDTESSAVKVRYKFPFGVWFRGAARICLGLEPSLFRHVPWEDPNKVHHGCEKRRREQRVVFDECSMVNHYREYLPDMPSRYGPMFDWLCLMQEHGAPTRLLDWTENILYALYFAVREREVDCDGAVWILNAGRLNEITRLSTSRRYVCFPNSADVHLRTAMAISHTWTGLRRSLAKLGLWEQVRGALKRRDILEGTRHWPEMQERMLGKLPQMNGSTNAMGRRLSLEGKLQCPVAVFPGRGNRRLAAQLGAFTLHGGKTYDSELRNSFEGRDRFADPLSLVRLNDRVMNTEVEGKRFLDVWVVPSGSKRKIREQLKRLGVHAASVFPDLEYQSEYMKREWMIGED